MKEEHMKYVSQMPSTVLANRHVPNLNVRVRVRTRSLEFGFAARILAKSYGTYENSSPIIHIQFDFKF